MVSCAEANARGRDWRRRAAMHAPASGSFVRAGIASHAGEEADEDPLGAALAQERSHAAHARSAELGAAVDPDGGISNDSRRFSYYALEGATGAVRWRHDVRTAATAHDSCGVDGMLLVPLHDFTSCCSSAVTLLT